MDTKILLLEYVWAQLTLSVIRTDMLLRLRDVGKAQNHSEKATEADTQVEAKPSQPS